MLKIAAIILLLFIILVLLLSIPSVQTRLGRYLTDTINEDFGTNITIEKVGLQFNGDVELKQIFVEDHKKDTLISIEELNTSILSFNKLFNNKFTFGDVDIYGLIFNLKTYKGEKDTNLDVFVAKFDEDTPQTSTSNFLLSSSDVSISDSQFRLIDENEEISKQFALNDLNVNATNFVINGPDVNARINKLSFIDDRGLEVKNLTTNFGYTLEGMNFEYLQVKTEKSTLNGNLKFIYKREDLQYFIDKVRMEANFENSQLELSDLNIFFDEFGKGQSAKFDVNLFGTLNDLTANDLVFKTPTNTYVDGDFKFKNAFGKEENTFTMDAKIVQMSSTSAELKRMLPRVLGTAIPEVVNNLGRFSIEGTTNISTEKINADLEIASSLGTLISEFEISNLNTDKEASYSGNIISEAFDLGSFIEDDNFGTMSMNVDLSGTGFTAESINSKVSGNVFSFKFNDYEYQNLKVAGNIRNKIFDGNLIANDPNANLTFSGLVDFSEVIKKYDFNATVEHANLRALNFVTKDSISVFKGNVSMNMNGSNFDDAYGNVRFRNTFYKNQHKDYYFKDFAISSKFENDIRFIDINSPDIVKGSLSGKFIIKDLFKMMENSLGNIYTNYEPHTIADNQFINFKFNIYNTIAEIFYPDLNLGNNTYLEGHIESDAKKFKLEFSSPQIRLEDYFASKIHLEVDNENPIYNTFIQVDSVFTKHYNLSKLSLINVTKNDTLFIKTDFKGGKANKDDYDLNLFYTINEANNSVLGFRKSNLKFKENEWFLNEEKDKFNKIEFDRQFRDIKIQSLRMSHEDEVINLYGVLKDSTSKNINLDFKNVELAKITPVIDSLDLKGSVNGKLSVQQRSGIYIPTSNVSIDNFKVNDFNLGSFNANITGNRSLTSYNVNVRLKDDNTESLAAIGRLDFSGKNSTIDLNVNFDEFILNPLNPFGEGVITNIRGDISGNAKVTGRLNRPQINGQLALNNGGISIPYLNVDYSFEDDSKINLSRQSFIFNNARLIDTESFSKAQLSGNIDHVNFSNWQLNLNINSDRLLVLNTAETEESLYYGTAFVSGRIGITGPTDQLLIKADVASEEGTVFKVPLNDVQSFGDHSFIRYVSKNEKELEEKDRVVLKEVKGLEMDFDLDVTQNAEIEIIMDKSTGSSIKGRGSGLLNTIINTNDKFEMYGEFVVLEGIYNFNYEGIIEKEFKVVPGGNVIWEGEPLSAQVNIEAIYDQVQANPSVLLENPINQSTQVEVKIHLTESLEKPDFDFELRFPDVNSTLNSELQYRLNDKEQRTFQALSLLSFGSFRNDFSVGTQDAFGLVSDRVESLINEIISSKDGKVNLGVDLQLGQNTPDFETDSRVGVTLSTKLSENILINGKVGVPIGGVSETVIAGNFEIEMLINEDRTLSLKFFNRENNIRYFGEQIGYTQGIGLSYNVEFDTLEELFKKVFGKKEKSQERAVETRQRPTSSFINYRKKKTDSINNSNN